MDIRETRGIRKMKNIAALKVGHISWVQFLYIKWSHCIRNVINGSLQAVRIDWWLFQISLGINQRARQEIKEPDLIVMYMQQMSWCCCGLSVSEDFWRRWLKRDLPLERIVVRQTQVTPQPCHRSCQDLSLASVSEKRDDARLWWIKCHQST